MEVRHHIDCFFTLAGRPKRTDLDMSKVFVGTCPDMCPEKERYMRETRNQLSSFEVVPETEKVGSIHTLVRLNGTVSQHPTSLCVLTV